MAELRLSVEIVEFDLTHVRVKLSVLGKRKSDAPQHPDAKKLYQHSAPTLKMTLIELHIFLRALLEFKGPLELTTPDMTRDRGADEAETDSSTSFLAEEPFYSNEAAE